MPAATYAGLIGRPFEAGGRGPGYDCWGLCRSVLQRNGIDVPDYPSTCDADRNASLIIAAMESGWEECEPQAFAVALFRMDRRLGTHVGVMVDGQRFVHVIAPMGVCVERISHPLWRKRILGFYRWKGTK